MTCRYSYYEAFYCLFLMFLIMYLDCDGFPLLVKDTLRFESAHCKDNSPRNFYLPNLKTFYSGQHNV